jgi:DNA-binding NarL/FixJ family response regulator
MFERPLGEELLTLGPARADAIHGRTWGRVLSTMHAHSPITVAIARFDDLVALGLQTALEADPSISIVARDLTPARIGSMLRVYRPRVLILDVGSLGDYVQVREITIEHPETRLVLLGHGLSSVESAQLLAFGASVCLTTGTQLRDLRHAIHLASRGLQLQLLPTSPGTQATEPLLTPREGDVLSLLRQNRTNAQIALALGIGVETVRSHARHIYRKLGVSSRRTLLALAGAGASPAPAGPATYPATYPARSRSVAPSDARRPQRRPQHH